MPGDGGRIPRQQYIGEVKTWGQTVEVVFTEIDVVSDGDTDGAGDLMFTFVAEDGLRTLGAEGERAEWNDGSTDLGDFHHRLDRQRLRIHVSG